MPGTLNDRGLLFDNALAVGSYSKASLCLKLKYQGAVGSNSHLDDPESLAFQQDFHPRFGSRRRDGVAQAPTLLHLRHRLHRHSSHFNMHSMTHIYTHRLHIYRPLILESFRHRKPAVSLPCTKAARLRSCLRQLRILRRTGFVSRILFTYKALHVAPPTSLACHAIRRARSHCPRWVGVSSPPSSCSNQWTHAKAQQAHSAHPKVAGACEIP